VGVLLILLFVGEEEDADADTDAEAEADADAVSESFWQMKYNVICACLIQATARCRRGTSNVLAVKP
jgi:hypothetical protein